MRRSARTRRVANRGREGQRTEVVAIIGERVAERGPVKPRDHAGYPTAPLPEVGRLTLRSKDGPVVTGLLVGTPVPVLAEAGWETVERRKRQDALDWTGGRLDGWQFTILFNTLGGTTTVGERCFALEGLRRHPKRGERPPTVRVKGVPAMTRGSEGKATDWVVTTVEPAETDKWIWRDRRRVRALYTVTLLEASFVDVAKIRPAKRTRDRRGRSRPRTYVVKRSDKNLRGIAQRQLGDGDRWREIAKLNKIRGVGKNLKVGKRLKLP